MGYFTDTGTASAWGVVRPLTREAVSTVLDDWAAHYRVDDDGDVVGYWDGNLFVFLVRGGADRTLLSVRGRWARQLPLDHRAELLDVVDEWHRDTLWPKCYLREEDDELAVYTELNVPLGRGTTLAQLAEVMQCALATGCQLFDHLVEKYPDPDAGSGDE